MTAAYFLAKKGYPVTIFEASAVLGGMLAQAIPEFRSAEKSPASGTLPISSPTALRSKPKPWSGRDLSIEELREQGYEAVFMAIGAHQGLEMGVFGENLYEGVVEALEYLKASNRATRYPGQEVVVIGGGYAAVDAARTAVRRGAEVHLVYRRDEKDLPADPLELRPPGRKASSFIFYPPRPRYWPTTTASSAWNASASKTAGRDTSGRQRVLPKEGTEYVMAADLIIAAVGLNRIFRPFTAPPLWPFPPGRPCWWTRRPCRPASLIFLPGAT